MDIKAILRIIWPVFKQVVDAWLAGLDTIPAADAQKMFGELSAAKQQAGVK